MDRRSQKINHNTLTVPLVVSLIIHSTEIVLFSFIILPHDDLKDESIITISEIIPPHPEKEHENENLNQNQKIFPLAEKLSVEENSFYKESFFPNQDSLREFISFVAYINMLNEKSPLSTDRELMLQTRGELLYAKGLIDSSIQNSLLICNDVNKKIIIPKFEGNNISGILPYNSSIDRHPNTSEVYKSPVKMTGFKIPVRKIINFLGNIF